MARKRSLSHLPGRGWPVAIAIASGMVLAGGWSPAVGAPGDACDGSSTQNGVKVAASHGKVLYIDSGTSPPMNAAYAGYRVTNTSGSPQDDLWASFGSFSGGIASLANPLDQYQKVPAVTNNGMKTVFVLLKASQPSTTPQRHVVRVFDGRPDLNGSTELYSCTFTFSKVKDTIQASANKVTSTTVSSGVRRIGETVTVTVEGNTGTVGDGQAPDGSIIWLSPAAFADFPTRALRLESTSITLGTGGQAATYTDQLLIGNAKAVLSSSQKAYTAQYTFRVIGTAGSSVSLKPIAQIASGTQIKHTTLSGSTFGAIALDPGTVTNPMSVAKRATATTGLTTTTIGGITYVEVPYEIKVTSSSSTTATVDDLVDTPADGTLFRAGSASVKDVSNPSVARGQADPSYLASEAFVSPRPNHFTGPFRVNSTTPVTLTYVMRVPCTSASFSNTAYGVSGGSTFGSSSAFLSRQTITTSSGQTCTTITAPPPDTVALDPSVETRAATGQTTSGATLNAVIDGNNQSPGASFDYGTSPTLGGATTAAAGTVSGADPTDVSKVLTGLQSGTTYYFRARAGSVTGSIMSFTTPEVVGTPSATTRDATSTGSTSVALNGTIDPNLTSTRVQFQYGTAADLTGATSVDVYETKEDGTEDTSLPLTLASGYPADVTKPVTGLTAGTRYYFRLVARHGTGYATATNGSILSFVAGATQSITLGSIADKATTAADFPISATASSTLSVTLTSDTPSACGFANGGSTAASVSVTNASPSATVRLAGTAGNCSITASQGGGNASGTNYGPAEPVTQSFAVIAPPDPVITAPLASQTTAVGRPTISGTCEAGLTATTRIYPGATATGLPADTITSTCPLGNYSGIPTSTLPDGTYTATTSQTNTAGTGTSTPVTFTVDTGAPLVTITTPAAAATLDDNTPAVGGACTAGDGTVSIAIWSGSTIPASGTPASAFTASCSAGGAYSNSPASGLANGTYTVRASQTDAAGNRGVSSDITFALSSSDLSDGAITANSGNTWSRSGGIAVDRSLFRLSGGSVTNSLKRRKAAWVNGDCDITWSDDATLTLDESTASAVITDSSGLTDACYQYKLSGSGSNGRNAVTDSGIVKRDATVPVLGTLQVAGGDGLLTNSAAPSIAKGPKSDAASGLKGSEEKLTRASSTYLAASCGTFATYDPASEVDIPLAATADSGLASGCYRYTHRVGDNAGNTTTTQGVVKVDVTVPAGGTMSVNSGNPWTNSPTPALGGTAFTDANSGIASGAAGVTREVAALSGATCGSSWTVQTTAVDDTGGAENSPLAQGCYRYTRTASDRAGNTASSTPETVKVDRTNPTGGSVTVAGGSAWTRSLSPSVGGSAFTDANSGIGSGSLTRQRAPLSGQTCGTYGTATAVTLSNGDDTATLDQACYRYTRGASDVAGNSTSTDSEVKIDRTNPTGGAVTANGGDSTWTRDARPSLTRSTVADANSGLASDAFTRGFAPFNGGGNCAGVTYSGSDAVTIDGNGRDADTNTLTEGCYRYRSTATDNVGNTTTTDATVFIDRTTPTGGSIAATTTGGAWANTASPGLSGSAFTDANSGINTSGAVTRIVRERAAYVPGGNACTNTWVVDDPGVTIANGRDSDTLDEACYRYTREAADNAGNTAATTPNAVQLDLTAPSGGVVTINGGTDVDATAGASPNINVGTFADALSGLRSGSETLTRRIAPWLGSASALTRQGHQGVSAAQEFGSYGSAVPVTLMGNEDPVAVNPGRYLYEHAVVDESGNVTTRTALVEIRPAGVNPPRDPAPDPAPIPPAERPSAAAALQLQILVPSDSVRANMPFPARAAVRNVGSVTAESVTFSTTAPGDVVVLAAEIRPAAPFEMQTAGRCAVFGQKTVTCTMPTLEARNQQVIDMILMTPGGGFRVVLSGDSTAANAAPVSAGASVPSEITALTGAAAPVLSVRATTPVATVQSGGTMPVAVTVGVRRAGARSLVLTAPARAGLHLARVPRGTDLVSRRTGTVSTGPAAAGSTKRIVMRFRVTGPVGSTIRVPVAAATPGAQPRMARTTAVRIIAGSGVRVTG